MLQNQYMNFLKCVEAMNDFNFDSDNKAYIILYSEIIIVILVIIDGFIILSPLCGTHCPVVVRIIIIIRRSSCLTFSFCFGYWVDTCSVIPRSWSKDFQAPITSHETWTFHDAECVCVYFWSNRLIIIIYITSHWSLSSCALLDAIK